MAPLANSYPSRDDLEKMEPFYPLHARVCSRCFLVQLPELAAPSEIFHDYAYLSSYSDTWRDHVEGYARDVVQRFGIPAGSEVVEVASNDGCLLRSFRDRGMRVLGIEPAANVAEIANAAGLPTIAKFFGSTTARELLDSENAPADLLVGNNVLAHVPDLHDFVEGLRILLAPRGTLTMEFPHLMRLIENNQFDTIYHEHFSYLSLAVVRALFEEHGLSVFDVEELPIHGGSLRVYAAHAAHAPAETESVARTLGNEREAGMDRLETYAAFGERARKVKLALLDFLIDAKRGGRSIAGYGAPAKGNTLLNYCGIRTDFLDYTVDRNPYKQGRFLPGTRIPIYAPSRVAETRPDFLLILPWNIREEITAQMAHVRDWGGKFVVPIPRVEVFG